MAVISQSLGRGSLGRTRSQARPRQHRVRAQISDQIPKIADGDTHTVILEMTELQKLTVADLWIDRQTLLVILHGDQCLHRQSMSGTMCPEIEEKDAWVYVMDRQVMVGPQDSGVLMEDGKTAMMSNLRTEPKSTDEEKDRRTNSSSFQVRWYLVGC